MDINELYWAAGLFEGEGTITSHGRYGIQIAIGMTDKEPLVRFAKAVQYGDIYGPYKYKSKTITSKRRKKHAPYWRWVIADKEGVVETWKILESFLCQRRKEQWKELEDKIVKWKPRKKRWSINLKTRKKVTTEKECYDRRMVDN